MIPGSMADRDLYAVLGVSRGASPDEIKTVYRKLARQHHPDVNPNDPKAEERFKEISFAYDVLSDAEKRSRYDDFGTAGLAEGFDADRARSWSRWSQGASRSPFSESFSSQVNLEDLFASFGAGRARGPAQGRDAQGDIAVDFLEAARGGEVRVQLEGKGPLRVRIPPGANEGTRIRLVGQGSPGREGGPPGNLTLTLHVRPHPFFTRKGDDLLVDLPVTLPELIRGASVEVPTPDGPVSMKIAPRSRNGQRLRLRGKGARRPGRDGSEENGDLLVTLVAELPATDDPRLDEIAGELDALYPEGDVRERLKQS